MPIRIFVSAILIGAAVIPGVSMAQDRAAWFKSLKQPTTGLSCCDISDCKRTEANWEKGSWWAVVRGLKRQIPDEKVVKSPISLDGEAYVCASENPYLKPEMTTIYCFVPPSMAM
jgi:hypothetical protein